MIRSDRDSIFGDTYQGVPNPQIPFEHPYPTRYHGAIFTTPKFGLPFAARPYAKAPYSGFGQDSPLAQRAGTAIGLLAAYTAVGAVAAAVYSARKPSATRESVGRVAGVATGLLPVAIGIYIYASLSVAASSASGSK